MNTSIVITGHGEFAEGFKSAITLLIGTPQNTHFVNFNEDFEIYQEKLTSLLKSLSETSQEVLVFTDLAGGSPFNVSCLAAKTLPNIQVLSGSNLPMIIDTITNVMYDLGGITPSSIISTGQESIVSFNKNSSKKVEICEDGI